MHESSDVLKQYANSWIQDLLSTGYPSGHDHVLCFDVINMATDGL